MKKLLFAFTVFILYFTFSENTSYSQSETSMQDILEAVDTKVTQLEENKKHEIVNITVDLVVNQGVKYFNRVLDPNYEYTIIVIGDKRISKLRLAVFVQGKKDKELVDETDGSNPVLKILPDDFGIYDFAISSKEYKDNNNAGHFALIVYHGESTKK